MTSRDHEAISHLIGRIYEGAIDPRRWQEVLAELATLLGDEAASQMVQDLGLNPDPSAVPSRSARSDGYGRDAALLLQRLVPHMKRAIQVQRRLLAAETHNETLAGMLDRVPTPVLLADERGHVIHVNVQAQRILARREALMVDADGLLRAQRSDETMALRRLLEAHRGGALPIYGPGGAVALLIVPIPADGTPLEARSMVFIADPNAQVELAPQALRRLYGLTASEARLAELLVQGSSVEEAAAQLRITLNTARTHLKRVFAKTGTRRQSQLIRFLILQCGLK